MINKDLYNLTKDLLDKSIVEFKDYPKDIQDIAILFTLISISNVVIKSIVDNRDEIKKILCSK